LEPDRAASPADTLAGMPRCIAFLRAVNVGGRFIKMEALRAAFEALGLAGVQTFIASGNVIFETRVRDLGALERKIESHLHASFGFEIHTFLRTEKELAAIVAHEAFDAAEVVIANTHVVGFVASAPDAATARLIERFHTEADRYHLHGRELHWISRRKQSETTFSNAAFERALKTRATFRNVSTLRKLLAKLSS
jgi:uncharacterized protein (DUF1697 family)